MEKSVVGIAEQFRLNTALVDRVLDGFSDEAMRFRPEGKGNPAHFVLGHIAATRYDIARLMGLELKADWAKLFDRGVELRDAAQYPSVTELRAAFGEVAEAINKRFEELTEVDLSAEPSWEPPGMEKSIRGVLNFLAFHESYHIGQLGYIRKLVGLEGAFG